MIAALPIYDRPGTFEANDALWQGVRAHLGYGPESLTRDIELWDLWTHPDLILGQTCNLPYRLRLHGKVQVLGCPDYGLEGCAPGQYNSVFVKRAEDPRPLSALMQARVLINQSHSQSGHGALIEEAARLGHTPNITQESGGHVNSARMIAAGEADLAVIDALSWRLMRRYDDWTDGLQAIGRTAPSHATPFICGLAQDAEAIRAALREAIAGLDMAHRNAIGLLGMAPVSPADLMGHPIPPQIPATA